jgi:cytoskeletal protein RodZ
MDDVDNGEEMQTEETTAATVGERLRAAREAAGMSLDEVATATRIPTRHLESLESGDFSKMPAPTYSIGFAKNYAGVVGLDRAEIAEQLRSELGTTRPAAQIDVFEPADPSRSMPRWLVWAALAAIAAVVIGFTWLKSRELDAPDDVVVAENMSAPVGEAPAAPSQAPAATTGPVALTASDQVWVEVREASGTILFQGEMAPGQRYELPATAAAPLLTTGRPEALRVTVGTTAVPQVGPSGRAVSGVSLLPADLAKLPTAPRPAPTAVTPAQSPPAQ